MAVDHTQNRGLRRGEAVRAIAVALVLVAAAVWPVLRQPPRDSFPHSTYPMFSELREPISGIEVAMGITESGSDVRLSPELIAGTEEVIVAGSVLRSAIRRGDETAGNLCTEIAERVASSIDGEAAPSDVVQIQLRTDVHDAIAWFGGDRDPLESTVHWSCEVSS